MKNVLSIMIQKLRIMNKILLGFAFLLMFHISLAQDENSTIGLRGGGVSGMTVKLIDADLRAMEIILGYQRNGLKMVGMVQRYKPIKTDRISNLYVFSGLGARAGFERYDKEETQVIDGITYYSYRRITTPVVGGDMIIGLEYQFESVPFNVSLDYKPYMEFFGEKFFRIDFWDIGFSIRYVINQ